MELMKSFSIASKTKTDENKFNRLSPKPILKKRLDTMHNGNGTTYMQSKRLTVIEM